MKNLYISLFITLSFMFNINAQNIDCNGVINGPAMADDCGVCHQAYIYNYITHVPIFINDTSGVILAWNELLILPNDPLSPYWNSGCNDCNGVINGFAMLDDCGDCQLAMIYNVVTHVTTIINDTAGLVLSPTEIIVLPNNPMNPNWNSSCSDCNGVANGLALNDNCGTCHSALVYNVVSHISTPVVDTAGLVLSPTEILVLPNDPMNPNWNNMCRDCNAVINGPALVDSCGICQLASVYNVITHISTAIIDTAGLVLSPTEVLVLPNDPMNPTWNSSCIFDCNGVINGPALIDSCGVCQMAMIYNLQTHVSTPINDTVGLVLNSTELLVLPNDPMNPNWNNCVYDCNGIVNGSSMLDDCGICHQAYLYNVVTHVPSFINDTLNLNIAWNEILILPNDPGNPYWNSSCNDCNGVVNGPALIDSCGVCQLALIYNFVTHVVTPINDTAGVVLGPTEMIVLPNNSMNQAWNSSCIFDCNGVVNGLALIDSCGVCQLALIYNYVTHVATPINDTVGVVLGPTEMIVLPNNPMNPSWNATCLGCTDPLAFNYNVSAIVDDGSCIPILLGCLDQNAVNYNPNANTNDGSCIYSGCTDPLASNYNSNATIDDGSCIYTVSGCTDSTATNYDPTATVDDGSCQYTPSVCAQKILLQT